MTENTCPKCQNALEWRGHYHCASCQLDYEKIGTCPDCDAQLEKLQACGATNYFCNSCKQLKSKSTIDFEFKVKAAS